MALDSNFGDPRNRRPLSSEVHSEEAGLATSQAQAAQPSPGTPEYWMCRYQQADHAAATALVAALSPALLRFFRFNSASREQAEDLLQETWLKIHRMRHSYRPGERGATDKSLFSLHDPHRSLTQSDVGICGG